MKKGEKKLNMSIENLKRQDRILAKMLRKGITREEIEWLGDFWQADAQHVWQVMKASDEAEATKLTVN